MNYSECHEIRERANVGFPRSPDSFFESYRAYSIVKSSGVSMLFSALSINLSCYPVLERVAYTWQGVPKMDAKGQDPTNSDVQLSVEIFTFASCVQVWTP